MSTAKKINKEMNIHYTITDLGFLQKRKRKYWFGLVSPLNTGIKWTKQTIAKIIWAYSGPRHAASKLSITNYRISNPIILIKKSYIIKQLFSLVYSLLSSTYCQLKDHLLVFLSSAAASECSAPWTGTLVLSHVGAGPFIEKFIFILT